MAFAEELEKYVTPIWDKMAAHPFMQGIRRGDLSAQQYGFYVKQNYKYLFHYAQTVAGACYKCEDVEAMRDLGWIFNQIVTAELDLNMHNAKKMGISGEELLYNDMSPDIYGYSNFLLKTACCGDFLESIVALYSCPVSYAYVAKKLYEEGAEGGLSHEMYGPWLRYYISEEADDYGKIFRKIINRYSQGIDGEREKKLKEVICRASQYDYMCLEMGWKQLGWPAYA